MIQNLFGGFRSEEEEQEGELITSRDVCPRCGSESLVSELRKMDNGELLFQGSFCQRCD